MVAIALMAVKPGELRAQAVVDQSRLPSDSVPLISMPFVSSPSPLLESEFAQLDAFPNARSKSDWEWHIRPTGFVYHTYWASAQEPRLSTQLIDESGNGSMLDSTIGGRIGLVRFGPRDRAEGFQLDLLASASLRQDPNEGLDVIGTDYRFDIPLTYGVGPHRFKLGYYHVSSHTGDEFLLKNPTHVRLNFFRDVLVFGYSYYATPELRLYGEAGWAFGSEFSEPWEFQFGLDYGPSHATGARGAPFIAINSHLREELDFGGNLAVQAGWAWRTNRPGDGTLRTGLYYYNGGSPQFSFYRESEQQTGWGLWYDY